MPEPTAGQARNPVRVDDAILKLGTKVGWHFEELPDCIRNASLLGRLAHEGYILARTPTYRSMGSIIVGPEGWVTPRNYSWDRYLERDPVHGPDLKLTDLGRVRFDDLQQGCGQGGEGEAKRSRIAILVATILQHPIVSTVIGGLILAAILALIGFGP